MKIEYLRSQEVYKWQNGKIELRAQTNVFSGSVSTYVCAYACMHVRAL